MTRQTAIALALLCGSGVAAAASLAQSLGMAESRTDPWVWILGGFGAAVVYVKNPPTTKANALINSLISVLIGGIVAPPIADYCGHHYDPTLGSPYPFAFVLSSLWPWILPFVLRRISLLIMGPPEEERRREEDRISHLASDFVEGKHHKERP